MTACRLSPNYSCLATKSMLIHNCLLFSFFLKKMFYFILFFIFFILFLFYFFAKGKKETAWAQCAPNRGLSPYCV